MAISPVHVWRARSNCVLLMFSLVDRKAGNVITLRQYSEIRVVFAAVYVCVVRCRLTKRTGSAIPRTLLIASWSTVSKPIAPGPLGWKPHRTSLSSESCSAVWTSNNSNNGMIVHSDHSSREDQMAGLDGKNRMENLPFSSRWRQPIISIIMLVDKKNIQNVVLCQGRKDHLITMVNLKSCIMYHVR